MLSIIIAVGPGDITNYVSRFVAEQEMGELMTTGVGWPSSFSSDKIRKALDSGDWSGYGSSRGPVSWDSFKARRPMPEGDKGE